MAKRNDNIKARLLAVFHVEAQEHLQSITANLQKLESELPPEEAQAVLEATFREVHTLKGAARSVSLLNVEALCQAEESLLSRITRGRLTLTRPILDLLHLGVDGMVRLVSEGEAAADMRGLIERLEGAAEEAGVGGQGLGVGDQGPAVEPPSAVPRPPSAVQPTDTIRLPTAKLDTLLLQLEDLLAPKLAAQERMREARALVEALEAGGEGQGLGVGGWGLGVGDRGASRMGRTPSPIPHPPTPASRGQARELLGKLRHDAQAVARLVDGLLEELRQMRLTPASGVLDLFPRMIRDLAREHGKEVEWVARGAGLEVDRKVLEAMKEPLIHLVRNAVDHGIEVPTERSQAGKPSRGRVAVTIASSEGGRIELRVEDDGRGIDLDRVRAAAVRAGLVTAEAAQELSDDAALQLIFRSGVSTSPIITDVSGHGLGLAIVKERVENLGGRILLETHPGVGTTVRMLLPASIATFRGLLVRAGGQQFLLPMASVMRAIRIAPEQIERVEGREAVRWNGQALSLARLSDLLGLPEVQGLGVGGWGLGEDARRKADGGRQKANTPPSPQSLGGRGLGAGGRGPGKDISDPRVLSAGLGPERMAEGGRRTPPNLQSPAPNPRPRYPCIILQVGEERVGLLVDEVVGDQEVLVKEFKPPIIRIRNLAGTGLLGTGQVALILRPTDLLKSMREVSRPPEMPSSPVEEVRQKVILVVDDSITTRTMEKNLLEAAGYRVRVAVDGIDAWTALKGEEIDLIVSDVDMPRLNGFELTARIRADRKLADLPVILVTVLESREYKERGIEAGANAYIVKSSFDQSNLLEIIRRLI